MEINLLRYKKLQPLLDINEAGNYIDLHNDYTLKKIIFSKDLDTHEVILFGNKSEIVKEILESRK